MTQSSIRKCKRTEKKLLGLISNYCNVTGYKSQSLFYTSDEQVEFEITNTLHFTLSPIYEVVVI